jgi:hypothetical protein
MSDLSEDTPLLSERSVYSTGNVSYQETREMFTSCADIEDVLLENDRLKKWELIAWDDYKKCRCNENMPTT